MPALGTILSTTSVPTSAEFDDHSARHENGGADEITVAGLSGTLADPQTPAAHAASHQDGGADEISIAGLAGTPLDLTAHLGDTADAHDASAISFMPNGSIAATDVQAAIQEVRDEATAGVTDADYLVGTAHAGLSAEIVVGATPGGELGGTWASPTVDATHAGSAHHDPVTVGTGLDVTGQLVELDLSEVAAGGELGGFMDAPTVDATHSGSTHAATQAAAESTAAGALSSHAAAADPHTGYRLESADHSHASTGAEGGTLAGYVPNPFTGDVDADGFSVTNVSQFLAASDGDTEGASASFEPGVGTVAGSMNFNGGNTADADGARVVAIGANGATPGWLEITTNGSTGDAGDLLTAQGDDTALWVAPAFVANPFTEDVDADGFTLKNLPDPVDLGDPVSVGFIFANLGLSTIIAVNGDADGNPITNLADPTNAQDAATKASSDAAAAAAASASIAKAFLDAKGDLISASANNTPSLLTVGANDTILMADSVAAAGLKWVASQTPTTQAFSDAAAQGTADTYARGDHLHGMPASPAGGSVTWLSIARWGL